MRLESPSSINTYKQCPRKYYYQYIKKCPTTKNIHLVRGKATHSVLEDFFKINIEYVNDFKFEFGIILDSLLNKYWANSDFSGLDITMQQIDFYYDETKKMIHNWEEHFIKKLTQDMKNNSFSLKESFERLTPETEVHYQSDKFNVQGYVDAVHTIDGKVIILDYKTSRRADITDGYKLQLGVYALLYKEIKGSYPDLVGIHFLNHGEELIEVTDSLVALAKEECLGMKEKTQSEHIDDYQKNPGPLCKYSTGQCDFFEVCKPFQAKEYQKEFGEIKNKF